MDRRNRYFQEVDVSRTKPFLIGLMLGAGLSFVALRYHVVRYHEGFMLVPRTDQPPVRSAYADIREWGATMWKQYPEVAEALVKDGQSKLVAESMTNSLAERIDGDDAESIDLLPEEHPAPPTRPASSTRKNPPSPIRLSPPTSERRTAPDRPARLSQPVNSATPRISSEAGKPVSADETTTRVRSALDSLFAPYDGAQGSASEPAAPANSTANSSSSIPNSSAAPSGRILELQDLNIDLGPARQIIPSTSIPQQANSVTIFSPRRLPEAAKLASSSPEPSAAAAVSTAPTHQLPLK